MSCIATSARPNGRPSSHLDVVTIANALISAAQHRQAPVALNTGPGEPGDEPLPAMATATARLQPLAGGPEGRPTKRCVPSCPAVSGSQRVARMAHDCAMQAMITMPEEIGM